MHGFVWLGKSPMGDSMFQVVACRGLLPWGSTVTRFTSVSHV